METNYILAFLLNIGTSVGMLVFFFAFFLHIKKWNAAKYFMLLSLIGSFMKITIDMILLSEQQRMNYFNSPLSNITEFLWYIDWIGFALALISLKTTPLSIKIVSLLSAVHGILNRPIQLWAYNKLGIGQWDSSTLHSFSTCWTLARGALFITVITMLFYRQSNKKNNGFNHSSIYKTT